MMLGRPCHSAASEILDGREPDFQVGTMTGTGGKSPRQPGQRRGSAELRHDACRLRRRDDSLWSSFQFGHTHPEMR